MCRHSVHWGITPSPPSPKKEDKKRRLKETIEVNPVPVEIHDVLEASVCKAYSLTGVNIAPEDLHVCHQMKRSDRIIIKLICCKAKTVSNVQMQKSRQ